MAKPKLALIPAAQGSELFSVLPSSGVGDFDFSRSGSATRINSQGLIEEVDSEVSRLNYPMIDGVVKVCPHHILEPVRTNLITYSEDVSQWINVNTTISQDDVISPDGTLNADKFEFTGDGSIRPNTSQLTFTNDYCFSVFIKKGNARYVTLWARFFTTETIIGFDLDTNTSENGGNIEDFGNDWYRLSINNNVTGDADRTGVFYIFLPNSLGGSNSVSGNNAYVWGAQVEEGSYTTSYIKSNSGSTNTRSAETANGSGDAATFNDSEGVLMAEISALDNLGSFENLSLSDGNNLSRVFLFYRNSLNLMEFRVSVNNSIQMQFQYTIEDAKTFNKMLIKYKQNDFAVWINGFELHTDNIGITFGSYPLTNLSFDNGKVSSPTDPFKGKIKQLQYFQTALTDSELEQLTSWTSFTDMAQGQLYTIE